MNKACLRPSNFCQRPTTALKGNSTGENTPGITLTRLRNTFVPSRRVVVSDKRKYALTHLMRPRRGGMTQTGLRPNSNYVPV